MRPVRTNESSRVASVTLENVCQHVFHVNVAMKHFNMQDPNRIFSFDDTSITLDRNSRQTSQKVVGGAQKTLYQIEIATKEVLDQVAVMSSESASGRANKPGSIIRENMRGTELLTVV